MKSFAPSKMKQVLARGALLVLCLSPLIGFGNIAARNREIENAGRIQQVRINALSDAWQGAQQRISAVNEMLAASRINAATALSEASKAMATKDVANKHAEIERLLKEADDIELRMDKQIAGFIPPNQNGWQNILGVILVMGLSAFVLGWARAADAASSKITPVFGVVCMGVSLALASFAYGQAPVAPNTERVAPLQPGGILGEKLGVYRTIEGTLSEGIKVETGTLVVDTVDGKKLVKPIPLVIRGAVIVDHNLQPAKLSLPPKQRCILKGFESGEMIGVPPAVSIAAKEQGWHDVPMSPKHWQWRSYFVALVVVEPKGLEIREPSGAVAQSAQLKPVDNPAKGDNLKSEIPMLNKLPNLNRLFKNPPRFQARIACFNGKVDSRSSCSSTNFQPDGTLHATGKMTCGMPGRVSEIEWSFIERREAGDVYRFTRRFAIDTADVSTTTKDIEFNDGRVIVFEDEFQSVVIEPPQK